MTVQKDQNQLRRTLTSYLDTSSSSQLYACTTRTDGRQAGSSEPRTPASLSLSQSDPFDEPFLARRAAAGRHTSALIDGARKKVHE